jgi:GH25 family lysozyme M1 (1,4-beta-N-acetylmuramidase)
MSALLSALFVFAMTAVSLPGTAFASVAKEAACSVNLRTSASTSATIKGTLKTGTKVTVATSVTGTAWKATCNGKTISSKYWYRISAVNGKSAKSLYGVTYVYGALYLFRPVTSTGYTRYAACTAYLRTSPSTTAASKAIIGTDTKVYVATPVTGATWSATCAGRAVSSPYWYQITAVNGQSVQSLYGVSYVYAANGLFKTAVTVAPTPTPTPTPTPKPTPTPTPKPTATPAPTPTPAPGKTIEGIDISHWQGTINWTSVAAAGKRFAFMKASEDTNYTDPTYTSNRSSAKAAGLVVGAYHFAQPSATVGNGAAQADHFVDVASPASGDLYPVLDLERSNGLTWTQMTVWVKEFLERVYQRTGVRGVIYCSPSFWKNYMGDTGWFASNGYTILWVAHWTTAPSPTVPAANWGGRSWTFWQYTSDGTVPGISGRVDLDRYNGTDLTKVRLP